MGIAQSTDCVHAPPGEQFHEFPYLSLHIQDKLQTAVYQPGSLPTLCGTLPHLDCTWSYERPLLFYAIRHLSTEDVIYCITHAPRSIIGTNSWGVSAVALAIVRQSSKDVLVALLGAGATMDAVNGHSLYHIAAYFGNADAVRMLAHCGYDAECFSSCDDDGMTPLMYAACRGHPGATAALLELGANVHVVHAWGTALHFLVRGRAQYHSQARALAKGVSRLITDTFEPAPVDLPPFEEQYVDTLQALLAFDADVNIRDCDGATPLLVAVQHGATAVARALLQRGADVSVVDNHGLSVGYLLGVPNDGCVLTALAAWCSSGSTCGSDGAIPMLVFAPEDAVHVRGDMSLRTGNGDGSATAAYEVASPVPYRTLSSFVRGDMAPPIDDNLTHSSMSSFLSGDTPALLLERKAGCVTSSSTLLFPSAPASAPETGVSDADPSCGEAAGNSQVVLAACHGAANGIDATQGCTGSPEHVIAIVARADSLSDDPC